MEGSLPNAPLLKRGCSSSVTGERLLYMFGESWLSLMLVSWLFVAGLSSFGQCALFGLVVRRLSNAPEEERKVSVDWFLSVASSDVGLLDCCSSS